MFGLSAKDRVSWASVTQRFCVTVNSQYVMSIMEEDVPNLIMEYAEPVAERVNVPGLLEDLHQTLLLCGLFEPDSVKSRSYPCRTWLVGEQGDLKTFIHIELSMLSGRTPEQKRELARSLIAVLEQHASTINSLTVDIRDMDRECFIKISR